MSTKYLNIKKDLSLIMSEDKIYKKTDLLKRFEHFINDSGFKLKKRLKTSSAPYECLMLNQDNEIFDLIIFLKNITGAGWKSKSNRRRVQVANIMTVSPEDFTKTSNNRTFIILGYYNFDDNPIMVAWDGYRYLAHNTLRSAYISTDNLLRGYKDRFLITTDSSQKVWIFDSRHFGKFLEDYILYNK